MIHCRMFILAISFIIALNIYGCNSVSNQKSCANSHEDELKSDGIETNNKEQKEEVNDTSVYVGEIEKTTSSVNENDLFLYEVISNRRMFISVNEDCQKFLWKDYNFIDGSVFDLQSFDKEYTIVDLDGDDNNELVINLGPIMVEIFDYQEGEVYGYQLPFRSISNITQGGKCLASDYGWYNITFDKNNINKHYFMYIHEDEFYIENESTTEQMYTEEIENLKAEGFVTWSTLIDENIENSFGIEEGIKVGAVETTELENDPKVSKTLKEVLFDNAKVNAFNAGKKSEGWIAEDEIIVSGKSLGKIMYYQVIDIDGDNNQDFVLYTDEIGRIVFLIDDGEKVDMVVDSDYDIRRFLVNGVIQKGNQNVWEEGRHDLSKYEINKKYYRIQYNGEGDYIFLEEKEVDDRLATFYVWKSINDETLQSNDK